MLYSSEHFSTLNNYYFHPQQLLFPINESGQFKKGGSFLNRSLGKMGQVATSEISIFLCYFLTGKLLAALTPVANSSGG